jgi:hypothetical protein
MIWNEEQSGCWIRAFRLVLLCGLICDYFPFSHYDTSNVIGLGVRGRSAALGLHFPNYMVTLPNK